MPKILILDVDSENIKNFKTYLQMSFPKVKTIYTLTNPATDLLLALREIRPDLIISDIRFFGVGAKKVIHDVSKVYPSTKFILYGTYNDTEYIKSVTEYGVIDFMYRPVKPLDFKRCMEHALRFFAEINAQKQREEELVRDYQKNVLLFQEKFFASVLSGVIEDEAEIMNSFRYFGFQFRGGFTVFIIRIDKFKEIVQNLGDADKHILSYKINNLVNMRIKERAFDGHAFITTFNTVSCVLSNSRSFEEILTFCGETIEDILQTLNLKVTIGLGRTYYSATDIAVSYREADSALQYRFYMGRGVAIPIAFVEPLNTITYKQSHKKQERLIHAAVTGEYEYCVKLLREIFRTFSDSAGGKVQEKLLHRFVMETLFSIGRYAMETDMDEEFNVTRFFSTKEVLKLRTIEEADTYLVKCLKELCDHTQKIRNEYTVRMLELAKEYIKNNYFENISLAKLALRLKTTGEFLNKLFIESEKMSCYDYIVRIRIDAAKVLLKSKNKEMTDNVVALKIGYDDVGHFRGVFKQLTGCSTNNAKYTYRIDRI